MFKITIHLTFLICRYVVNENRQFEGGGVFIYSCYRLQTLKTIDFKVPFKTRVGDCITYIRAVATGGGGAGGAAAPPNNFAGLMILIIYTIKVQAID